MTEVKIPSWQSKIIEKLQKRYEAEDLHQICGGMQKMSGKFQRKSRKRRRKDENIEHEPLKKLETIESDSSLQRSNVQEKKLDEEQSKSEELGGFGGIVCALRSGGCSSSTKGTTTVNTDPCSVENLNTRVQNSDIHMNDEQLELKSSSSIVNDNLLSECMGTSTYNNHGIDEIVGMKVDNDNSYSLHHQHDACNNIIDVLGETNCSESVGSNTSMIRNSLQDNLETEHVYSGAVWDIFRRQDVPKLIEYMKKHQKEFRHIRNLPVNSVCFFCLSFPIILF